jgi:hypothetical protein
MSDDPIATPRDGIQAAGAFERFRLDGFLSKAATAGGCHDRSGSREANRMCRSSIRVRSSGKASRMQHGPSDLNFIDAHLTGYIRALDSQVTHRPC